MMHTFYETGVILQIVLLVLSQFTVIVLGGCVIFFFKRGCKAEKQATACALLLVNIGLYVIMQLESRLTGPLQKVGLALPYALLLAITLLSLAISFLALRSETGGRKTISSTSIKESFDNLPTGVCFFNEAGLPVLCNRAIYHFSFAVCGKDVQFITDLEACLDGDFVPVEGVRKMGRVFVLENGSAWQLERRAFTYGDGNVYTQFIAQDVTDLHEHRVALMQENEQLRKVQSDLQRLSANVVAVTREEEILNAKMRVHDEMGRCLMAAQKCLKEGGDTDIPEALPASWKRAVSLLKNSSDASDEDMFSQIRKTCEFVKIAFVQTGELPKDEDTAYLLACAVRECVTNAVRYAEATELYADFFETGIGTGVTVTNNGVPPGGEITEGGGLSTLRRRVERAGGTMRVRSLPKFSLTVTIPNGREGTI